MNKVIQILRNSRKAARMTGRSRLDILREILALRLARGKIGISEYFDYQLYRSDLSTSQKKEFAGYRTERVLEKLLVDDYARFNSIDKITMYSLLASAGLPIPELRAVYGSRRPPTYACHLPHKNSLVAFLSTGTNLPVYMKPAFSSYGRGNALVASYSNNAVRLGDGSSKSLDTFCEQISDLSGLGWILQEPLQSHRDIAAISGSKVSGVRLHTFLTPDKVHITRAIWKINVGNQDSDNFSHGNSGNLLAAIDPSNGRLIRAIVGTGMNQIETTQHPQSGASLTDFVVPFWSDVLDIVSEGSTLFPGFLCPGWDIAICDDGPKVLEVNFFGDLDLSQHAYRKGFLDSEMESILRSLNLWHLTQGPALEWRRTGTNDRRGRRNAHWKW